MDGLSPTYLAAANQLVSQSPETKPSWNYRRKIVKLTLAGIGLLVISEVVVIEYNVIRKIPLDPVTASCLTKMFYGLSFVFVSIIGSYVFGAQWDINNFRGFVVNSLQAIRAPIQTEDK